MSISRTLAPRRAIGRTLAGATLLAASLLGGAHAAPAVDATGDFLSTFAGSRDSTDLDIVSVSATYDASTDTFVLSSTSAGDIGTTPGGLFVWGVNTGAGQASFAANGLDGVLFNQVVLLRPDGTGSTGGKALPTGSVLVSGKTLTATISGELLPSKGFAKQDYTWNLWPRDGAFSSAGFGAISDFAPNNSNILTSAVPEPSSAVLMAVGLGVFGLMGGALQRRR